jgi:hypothetical protein
MVAWINYRKFTDNTKFVSIPDKEARYFGGIFFRAAPFQSCPYLLTKTEMLK